MKRLLSLVLIALIGLSFVGCDFLNQTTKTTTDQTTQNTEQTTTTTEEATDTTQILSTTRYQEINLYSINDFHGGAYSSIDNLVQLGGFLKYQANNTDNSIIVANGDIFQGTALSNYYYGMPIVDVLNEAGFDGFVLGNHEFDWGIDKITQYRDGDVENGEMDYPILAANIVYEDSGDPLINTIPYITKEINGVKVGIIGVIGDVINSISASRTENIVFTDAVDAISHYASVLRTDESCDIVVVYIHEGSSVDGSIANLTGDSYVDAVFNGHTHQDEAGTIARAQGGYPLVYGQASNYSDSMLVKISLTYDNQTKEVIDSSVGTYSYSSLQNYSDQTISDILYEYNYDTTYRNFVDQVLCSVESNYYRYDLATWGASVIRDYAGVDIGVVNAGGFRTTMYSGDLTMGDLIVIYPFDNYIKTSDMTGAQLESFYEKVLNQGYDVIFDDSLEYYGGTLYINGIAVVATQVYTVGAVDYIFDKEHYDFLDGENITQTVYLMRDLLAQDLMNVNGSFNPYDGTHVPLSIQATIPTTFLRLKESILN